jgi:hypothetical protein
MLTKKNITNVLYSKLVKKKEKENDFIILGDLSFLKKIGLLSRATYPHTLIGLFSWATYSQTIFRGDWPTHLHGLFS